MTFWDFLSSVVSGNRDTLLVLIGALIGTLGSLFIWKRQVALDKLTKKRSDIVRAIELTLATLTHTRALMYATTEGIGAVASLPPNPVDELMALAFVSLEEILSLVQKLHITQQRLFGHPTEVENAASSMIEISKEIEKLANDLLLELGKLADKNKV